jgi:hypothetical protein
MVMMTPEFPASFAVLATCDLAPGQQQVSKPVAPRYKWRQDLDAE